MSPADGDVTPRLCSCRARVHRYDGRDGNLSVSFSLAQLKVITSVYQQKFMNGAWYDSMRAGTVFDCTIPHRTGDVTAPCTLLVKGARVALRLTLPCAKRGVRVGGKFGSDCAQASVHVGMEWTATDTTMESLVGMTIERIHKAELVRVIVSGDPPLTRAWESYPIASRLLPGKGCDTVYFLEVMGPAVKIGYSSDLRRRYREHLANTPGARLLSFRDGSPAMESALHRRLSRHAVPGTRETFYPVPELFDAMNQETQVLEELRMS